MEDSTPDSVPVPDLVGLMQGSDELKEKIDAKIFKLEYIEEFNKDYKKGTVIRQDPTAGSTRKVKPNIQFANIKLYISKGAETVKLPDYTDQEYRIVVQAIRDLGLIPEQKYEQNSNIELHNVIYTDPAPRTELMTGQTVTIYISLWEHDRGQVQVPNFIRMSDAAAYKELIGNDASNPKFELGDVLYEPSDEFPAGQVIWQSVESGLSVPRGTKINFIVSTGKK